MTVAVCPHTPLPHPNPIHSTTPLDEWAQLARVKYSSYRRHRGAVLGLSPVACHDARDYLPEGRTNEDVVVFVRVVYNGVRTLYNGIRLTYGTGRRANTFVGVIAVVGASSDTSTIINEFANRTVPTWHARIVTATCVHNVTRANSGYNADNP